MSHTTKRTKYLAIPTVVAVGSLSLSALAPAYASDTGSGTSQDNLFPEVGAEEDFDLGISNEDFEAALNHATNAVDDPVTEPEAFESEVEAYIQAEVNDGFESRALPAVIIAARFAGCVASAYTTLSAISESDSTTSQAAQIASGITGCIGGGVSADQLTRWILNNPQTARAALSAVGLGFLLEGDSATQAASSESATDPAGLPSRETLLVV